MTEYHEGVLDYQEINHGSYIVKMKDDEVEKVNTLPLQLAVFKLSNSKRIMNNFIHATDGFYSNDVYYTDTDSLYIENKHWDKLKEKNLVGKNFFQGKNDYGDGGIFYALFLAPTIKYCLTIDYFGIIDEKEMLQRIYKC